LGFLPDLLGFISDSSSPHSAFLHWYAYSILLHIYRCKHQQFVTIIKSRYVDL
jgi:hypothetical protein